MKEMLKETYEWTGDAMGKSGINTQFSGTTSVTLIVTKDYFITSNVGDSRCILVKQIKKELEAELLSRDHKPNIAGESERIFQMNGRIESYKDLSGNNVGPSRVWLKDEDVPGLAMSRSLGDLIAESVGVISTPDTKIYKR